MFDDTRKCPEEAQEKVFNHDSLLGRLLWTTIEMLQYDVGSGYLPCLAFLKKVLDPSVLSLNDREIQV